jgi:hypothetical protein
MKPKGMGSFDFTPIIWLAVIGLLCLPYLAYRTALFLWWAVQVLWGAS